MKTKNYFALIIAIAFLISIFAPLISVTDAELALAPRIHVDQSSTSSNWSGYAVTQESGSITSVKGSWTVPAVTGAKRTTSYSSFWVGIDGYNSGTVEQIGTDSDIQNGRATYYAWFEFYPNPAYKFLRFPVSPGDKISASVTYSTNGVFTVSITDLNTKKTATVSQTMPTAARSSAEWIAETPSTMSGGEIVPLPLANFGTVTFSSCTTTIGNGAPQTIASFGPMTSPTSFGYDAITMITPTAKAVPTALTTSGDGFSVQYTALP
jgi:hypothetical protein